MPVAIHKVALTDRSLKALKVSPEGRYAVWDALMPGLVVRVSRLGKRSFYAARRRAGDRQPTWVMLGAYPVMGLGKAREAAREALDALIEGQHPKQVAEAKRRVAEAAAREAQSNTLGAIAQQFIRQYVVRLRSARTYEARIKRELLPALGDRPITEVRRRDVIKLVEEVAQRSGEGAAIGTLSILRKLLGWALSRDIGLETNVASAVKANDLFGHSQARDRLLSDAELAAIWHATEVVGGAKGAVYKLLLLTGARRDEVADARWEDIDLVAGTLTVPAARSKNGEAQLIPLCPTAIDLISALPRFDGPFAFSTTAGRVPIGSFSHTKKRIDAAIAARDVKMPPWVLHDFRRAVRSGLGRLGVPTVVAELCLGHRQRGVVGVYDRHSYFEERRAALARWERHLMGLLRPEPEGDNVVELATIGAR
jgi:integrase